MLNFYQLSTKQNFMEEPKDLWWGKAPEVFAYPPPCFSRAEEIR